MHSTIDARASDFMSYLARVQNSKVNDILAQQAWAEKKYIWIADKQEGYVMASIVKDDGENVEVLLEDNTVY